MSVRLPVADTVEHMLFTLYTLQRAIYVVLVCSEQSSAGRVPTESRAVCIARDCAWYGMDWSVRIGGLSALDGKLKFALCFPTTSAVVQYQ